MRLQSKRALVTGGSRGIGRAISEGLAAQGAVVALGYREHESEAHHAVKVVRDAGGVAFAVRADISVKSEVERMVRTVLAELGGIDVLVNNAGVLKRTPFLEISENEWDWLIGVNLKGYFLAGQIVALAMAEQGGGAIVNISSTAASQAAPNVAHYCASKGGVAMLTRAMALELAPLGIRVNAVAPGTIETQLGGDALSREDYRSYRLSRIPLGRIGQPRDVVGAVIYLASDDARYVTGATFHVDGGSSILQ